MRWAGAHLLQLASLVATLVLGIPTLIFAWRGWYGRRRIVRTEILPLSRQKMGRGELRRMQTTLTVRFWAERNDAYLRNAFLVAGGQRVRGETMAGQSADARLRVGQRTLRYWASTDVRHLPPNTPWKVSWEDSEQRLHRGATLSREDVRSLTTEKAGVLKGP